MVTARRGGTEEESTGHYLVLSEPLGESAGQMVLGLRGLPALVVTDQADPIPLGEQIDGPGEGVETTAEQAHGVDGFRRFVGRSRCASGCLDRCELPVVATEEREPSSEAFSTMPAIWPDRALKKSSSLASSARPEVGPPSSRTPRRRPRAARPTMAWQRARSSRALTSPSDPSLGGCNS